MNKIAIYGASGHGKVVRDLALLNGYKEVLFIDDGDNDFPTLAEFAISDSTTPVALAVGDNATRDVLFRKVIQTNMKIVTLIHPSAIIARDVDIGAGSVIMAGVIVNSDTKIGKGAILNSGCIVEHDNHLGDFVHISPKAALAGNVNVASHVHVGIGCSVVQGISIGANAIIGAGAVVLNDVLSDTTVAGVPAKEI